MKSLFLQHKTRQLCVWYGSVSKPCTPVVHIKIAGKWMFIPLKMVLIGTDPYPYVYWALMIAVFFFVAPLPSYDRLMIAAGHRWFGQALCQDRHCLSRFRAATGPSWLAWGVGWCKWWINRDESWWIYIGPLVVPWSRYVILPKSRFVD